MSGSGTPPLRPRPSRRGSRRSAPSPLAGAPESRPQDPGDEAGGLAKIATALDDALRREFDPETRPFAPHLTMARSDPPLRLPQGFAERPLDPAGFTVDRIVLFRSHLGRPAPRYEALETFPLSGS